MRRCALNPFGTPAPTYRTSTEYAPRGRTECRAVHLCRDPELTQIARLSEFVSRWPAPRSDIGRAYPYRVRRVDAACGARRPAQSRAQTAVPPDDAWQLRRVHRACQRQRAARRPTEDWTRLLL